MEERYRVRIQGTSPLLQHRFVGGRSTQKTGQTYNNEKLAEESRYCDAEGNLVQPALHLEAAMIKAAANFRFQGKKTFKDPFRSAVFIEPELIPHEIQEWTIDERPVVVNKSRIIRARARLDAWALSFVILVIDERITGAIVKDVLTDAGQYYGIGDNRPRFGRFEVVGFERVEEAPEDEPREDTA